MSNAHRGDGPNQATVPGSAAGPAPGKTDALVTVRQLTVRFASPAGDVQAVNGIDLDLARGEVLGLIGESGCGKSVTMRALMRLLPGRKTRVEGAISIAGRDILAMNDDEIAGYRGATVAMVFQDPSLALDPVYTIGEQIVEAILCHETDCSKAEATRRALELLERVRVPEAKARLASYPHELSGGMRQRAMIALALSCRPQLLLADEPTTALDATVQIQVLLILRELQQQFGLGVVFVTHDLGVAAEVCDRVAVMYAGRIVESGSAEQVLLAPRHPYTQALLASTIHGSMRGSRIEAIAGAPPDLANLPRGCAFRARCDRAITACSSDVPPLASVAPGHQAACIAIRAIP